MFGRVDVGGDAAPIVDDGDRAVFVQDDFDAGAKISHRFVDGVVNHFVNKVMQPARGGVSDVHRRSFADGFEAFQHLDIFGAVLLFGAGHNLCVMLNGYLKITIVWIRRL